MVQNSQIYHKLEDLRSGKLTCEQNVKDFLANIEKNNKKYNIFLETNKNALNYAKKLDEKRNNGDELGSFYGLVFALKSNISIKGLNVSCASKTLEDYRGTYDADIVRVIKEEDGIVLGMVNCDEFASGFSGETSYFGKTINPVSVQRVPGGSSSGSAAAVAANMCDIAMGSDTGGSIRNPASHCGVVGVKPSYGRVSRYGLIDLSMSLDQIGPFSNDIYGCALVMSKISGFSENDSITKNIEVGNYANKNLDISDKKYKIGVIKEFEDLVSDKRILDMIKLKQKKLEELGHEIVELSIKNIELGVQAYYPIVYTEFYSGTRKFDSVKYGSKIEESAGVEVLRRILGGKEISRSEYDGAYYKKALRVKEVIEEQFSNAFKDVDFIISPVTPKLPHKFDEKLTPEESYAYDAFTIPANLAGICGGVVSNDFVEEEDGKVMVGTQVLADKFREDLMFEGMSVIDNLK